MSVITCVRPWPFWASVLTPYGTQERENWFIILQDLILIFRCYARKNNIKRSFPLRESKSTHRLSSHRRIKYTFPSLNIKLSYLSSLILSVSYTSSLEILSDSRLYQEYIIPLNVTSQVLIPKYSGFEDSYDVVGFVNDPTRRDANTTFSLSGDVKNVTASYIIDATICIPSKNSGNDKTLLLASHGLGYDRSHVFKPV